MLLASCGSLTQQINNSEVYSKSYTGFYLIDPSTGKVIADYNGEKYFTPASNTKIFTFYTALNILSDSIPGLKYRIAEDSIIIWGTGDPSFLHSELPESLVYSFLKNREEKIYISLDNFQDEAFGPGWSWDDYPYYFQPEKSAFPIYGNVTKVRNRPDTSGIIIQPDYLSRFIYPKPDEEPGFFQRDLESNIFYTGPQPDSISFEKSIPFKYSAELVSALLADTLKSEVEIIDAPYHPEALTLYSIPSDSLYKLMMEISDNFIAEQIMLMCAGMISDTLQTQIAIEYSLENLLADLPDPPVWRDGSGLSRYNLFTPRTIVKLWEKIYEMVPEERLFELIAKGGVSGTIKGWYSSEVPYIFGKTGTLSNNHTLSGFLKTKKGKTLIFSFMHNNYTSSSSEIKKEMEKTLLEIHEKY
jgi:D-alanyl-D-alanine carboxypeptidase/D-alanyl-D-alanine-endopeptidase (penicillin-binding protein 4)